MTPTMLAADEFDYLELLSLINGGVGAGEAFKETVTPISPLSQQTAFGEYHTPCCIIGLCSVVDRRGSTLEAFLTLDAEHNDAIVTAYVQRHPGTTKMPWNEYVKAYPLQRGQ